MKNQKRTPEQILQQVAALNGTSVSEVKREIRFAMLAGLCSQEPAVAAMWRRVPREGELPTPEELIAFLAETVAEQLENCRDIRPSAEERRRCS